MLLLLLLARATFVISESCIRVDEPVFYDVKSLYSISQEADSQENCFAKCRKLGGELVSIETGMELSDLNYVLDSIWETKTGENQYWTSGRKTVRDREFWRWIKSFDLVSPHHWCKNNPVPFERDFTDQRGNDFIMLSNNFGERLCFKNMVLTRRLPYICEKPSGLYEPPFDYFQPDF